MHYCKRLIQKLIRIFLFCSGAIYVYFHTGYLGLSSDLSSLFCFYVSKLLSRLSTLGYVNKPMVGIGMHIVGLHSAEKKGDKATTCIYAACFDISEIQTSLSPVILLHLNSAEL